MTRLPFIESTLIEQFLWAQHFRHPATRKNYAAILRNFSCFLANHDVVASPSIAIVQQWLKEHSLAAGAHPLSPKLPDRAISPVAARPGPDRVKPICRIASAAWSPHHADRARPRQ
ncbi:MAG: hypothetical protein IPI02_01165 [Sterolibacteriaceae bacterium]|nr:hypothetical protein [Sterolibacteriaceae bacterium]